MREDKNRYDRVSRRSSTGGRRDPAERSRRERIRVFDDTDDFYQINEGKERRNDSYEYDRRDDRDDHRYVDNRRYEDDRRYDERRYEDSDRHYDERRYEDERRRDGRHDDLRQAGARREEKRPPRKQAGNRRRRAGGDTERFVHQIVPYVMFWVALFAAVSFILRDLVGLDDSVGAFGNWFANFLCGLFGSAAYILPLFFVVIALRWKKFVREGILARKLFLSMSFILLLSGIIHVFLDGNRGVLDTAQLYTTGALRTSGGVFGGFVGEYTGYFLRLFGTILLAIPLLIVVGIYLVGLTPSGLWQRISLKCKQIIEGRRQRENAKYDGKEERRVRVSSKKDAAAQPQKPLPSAGEEKQGEPVRYTFREEDEPTIAHVQSKDKVQDAAELVDIPDDDIDEAVDAAPAIKHSERTQNVDQTIEEILRELEKQDKAEPAAKLDDEEEKPLQGSYYAPFALPVRPEPLHGHAASAAVPMQEAATPAASTTEAPYSAKGRTTIGPLGSIDNIAGIHTKREEAPTPAFEQEDDASLFAAADAPEQASAVIDALEEVQDPDSFLVDDEEDAVAPSVTFERVRLGDEPQAAAQPLRAEQTEQSSFAFDTEEDEQAEVVDEIDEAVDVANRMRMAFDLPDEAAEKPASSAYQSVPRVVAHAEPVQDQKPTPTPPPAPREYRLPPISLLNEDKAIKEDDHSEENQEKIDILRRTLESFNVHIKEEVVCSRGPTITRYEVRPEIGVPVRSIMNRIDDISLYMEAQVRIAPIQGKAAVGVEVPNKVRETVYLRTLLESESFKRSKNPVEVALGVGIGGDIQMCDLTAMPHLLVAGATKSGKSVCINTIILSLLYKTSPKDLRLILIDPKRVEFKPYMHLPHLYAPIITETAHAVGALACAVREMERRYMLLEDVGARNFEAYNEKVKNDPEREHLPYIVIIIDEYYDLKMACPNNDLENFACRLAQKARAAGIHLIIGTQRPSVNVITGTLKANIPSRIAFTVMQQVDSRTILDAVGAELLTGRGDMLYAPMGEKPIRLQGSFVSDDEVEAVVSFVRDRNDPVQYNQAFMDQIEIEVARAANAGKKSEDFDELAEDEDGDADPKFYDAVVLAVQTQKVATSLLQRRLGVGYGRAAKIIDRMEELGLVTPAEGNKPRKLLPAAQGYLDHMASLDGEEDGGDFDTDGSY